MNTKTKISMWVVLMLVVLGLGVSSIPQTKAQFVIAWDYDSEYSTSFDYDDYGQGFYLFHLMTNYTFPDWDLHPDHTTTYYFNESTYVYEWTEGYAMGIRFLV